MAAGGEGAEKSNRSPIILVVAGGGLFGEVVGDVAEENAPKSPPKDSFLGAEIGCDGGDVGFGGAAGFVSKKDPPLSDDFEAGGCRVWPVGEVRFENGDGLVCACCAGGLKERELKASFMPPNDCEGGCAGIPGGACEPPNERMFEFDCGWGCGGAAGLDA